VNITEMKAQLNDAIAEGLKAGRVGDDAAVMAAGERAERLFMRVKEAERADALRGIGRQTFHGADLASTLLEAGFDLKRRPNVTVPIAAALGVQFKTGSVDGGVDGTEIVDEFTAPALGLDERYVYTHVRVQQVAADTLGVHSYRQKSRSLASASTMLRSITEMSAKPETNSEAEVVNEPLQQIATMSSGTPNVLLASDSFRSWINTDLVAAYRGALDYHIVSEVGSASIPPVGGTGTNTFEDILYAQEAVRTAGYNPDTVAVSPGDALAVLTSQLSGGDSYIFRQTPPAFVVSASIQDGAGFVFDSNALGILFLTPFTLQTFEESAGSTNSSTVRAESNGLFLVQRSTAAASLSVGSS
jgi:hypothetical protein